MVLGLGDEDLVARADAEALGGGSPRPRLALAMPYATRLRASVAFAVQTTSDGDAAPTKPATVARASS